MSVPIERSHWSAAIPAAAARLGVLTWLAMSLTFAGWFLLDTLRVVWGPIDRRVPFYDLAAVVESPVRLFTGIDGHRGFTTILFIVLCCLTLLTPFLPHLWRNRFAWLTWLAPLALMLVAAYLLHSRTSDEITPGPMGLADTIANDVRHIAKHVFHSARESVARKVTFASGGYLAAIGALYLAARGVYGFRSFRK